MPAAGKSPAGKGRSHGMFAISFAPNRHNRAESNRMSWQHRRADHSADESWHLGGEWLEFRGSKLMAAYHPAYLLRNPAAKGEVWKDLQKVMAELGLAVKRKNS